MGFLEVNEVSKKKGTDFYLKSVSFVQQQFQNLAIAGATGSGKSTLLKIVAGIASPGTGDVWFEGQRVKRIPEEKLIPGHPGIAYLSQHFELRNHYRMEELLSYANILSDAEAMHICAICRVGHLLKRKATELSGGEKQRMALAILLVSAPRLLVLDEPFSNLDLIHKNLLKTVIKQLSEELNITCILVSHDPLDTLSWADEMMVLKDGEIIQQGKPYTIYKNPINEYVAGLFGSYNLLDAALLQHREAEGQVFIRPEDLLLVDKKNGFITGKLSKINFFGSYYELEIVLPTQLVIVKTLSVDFAEGDTLHLQLKNEHLWRL